MVPEVMSYIPMPFNSPGFDLKFLHVEWPDLARDDRQEIQCCNLERP